MSNLLKNLYSNNFFQDFSKVLTQVIPNFDNKKFEQKIFIDSWQEKELKQRMRHTTLVLHSVLESNFKKATQQIEEIIKIIRKENNPSNSLLYLFLPDYIEMYGIDDFEISTQSMEYITKFISCEFAVRPFIKKYGKKMITQMKHWSTHEDHHVRRLASEGSRPRLPWAMALPELKKDPSPILPILENLKTDPSEYVRRSVANSLNDIAKDNPYILIDIAKKWKGISKPTDRIIKHGARTLLKQGNTEILNYYKLFDNQYVDVKNFIIQTNKIRLGDSLSFSFLLVNTSNKTHNIRLEYAIYYLRQNGTHARKVFKISEKQIQPNEKIKISRNQSFRSITTRKFYPGSQKIAIILNGIEKKIIEFHLLSIY